MAPRVLIVGGGILGAATAFRLAQAGASVTLLEAGRFGHGASIVSFAWLNASDKPPFEYHLLNVSGMNEYLRLREEWGQAPWLHLGGHIEWEASDGGPAWLREKVDRLRGWGYAAELLPVRELAAMEPDLVAPQRIMEFAYYPDEGYLDPVLLIAHLLGAARAAGAALRPESRVANFVTKGGRVAGVETVDGERLMADLVVSCAGRQTDALLRQIGIELPMAPVVGMTAVSAPAAVRLRSIHHDDKVHFRPDGAGRVMMGHDDFDRQVQPGEPVAPAIVHELCDRAAAVLPGLAGVPIEAARVTIRPIPGDEHSVVGFAPGVDGLYLIVTHSAVTLGALLGRLASYEILGDAPDPRLAPFRPERLIAPALV